MPYVDKIYRGHREFFRHFAVIKTLEKKIGVQWDCTSATYRLPESFMIQLGGKTYTTFALNLLYH